jgi:S-adenosylmethionine decarboxylase
MKRNVNKKTTPFGMHLMLDMYNCSFDALNDKQIVYNALKSLPKKIKMKILLEPIVVFAQPNGKKDPGGWSGFVILQESHMSVHTFIKRKFVTIDVYACKEFDSEFVLSFFKKIFGSTDLEYTVESRGKKYPNEDIE